MQIHPIATHSNLPDNSVDNHTQYLLTDGTRALTGNWAANKDITGLTKLVVDNLTLNGNNIISDTGTVRIGSSGLGIITTGFGDITLQPVSGNFLTLKTLGGENITFDAADAGGVLVATGQTWTNLGTVSAATSITTSSLTIDLEQDWKFTGRSGETSLWLQSQTAATPALFRIASKDEDGTDDVQLQIWGKGGVAGITNRERMLLGFTAAASEYRIQTEADGSGTLRPLVIFTEGNTDQLKLYTDGNVEVAAGDFFVDTDTLYVDATASRVGIGTTSPGAMLDIEVDSVIDGLRINATGSANTIIRLQDEGTETAAIFTLNGLNDLHLRGKGDVFIDAAGGSNGDIFIDSATGNVGIGTTGPDRKLDVLDASNPQLRLTHTDGSVYSEFQTDSSGNLIITNTGGSFTFTPPTDTDVTFNFTGTTNSGSFLWDEDNDYFKFSDDIALADAEFLVMDKASGNGFKVDTTTPTFGFADLLGRVISVNTGASKPTHSTYRDGIKEFEFAVGDEDYFEFHIPHDYVKGTDIFLHIHWSHIGTFVNGGTITFSVEQTYSKSHNQAAFPATVTGTYQGTASNTQYQQILSETQSSASTPTGLQIDTDDLEPDGVILMTLGISSVDITVSEGAVPNPFIHYVDIHYQTTGLIGTKQKAPDFYGDLI